VRVVRRASRVGARNSSLLWWGISSREPGGIRLLKEHKIEWGEDEERRHFL
jgi:hypothetical protein